MLVPSSLAVHGHGAFGYRLLPSAEWGGEVFSTLPGTGLPSYDPRPIYAPRIVSKAFRPVIGVDIDVVEGLTKGALHSVLTFP
jgi:hypothetical protein